jgi:SOS response regulatory protein OraA/RecX
VSDDPAAARAVAYAHGLRLLAGREMAESALRHRLLDRGFSPAVAEETVTRLVRVGALDDSRAVRAAARTLVAVKLRGRLRAQRELEAKGFRKEDAVAALTELLHDADEGDLVERALDARLRGRPLQAGDVAGLRRVYAALVRRGFAPGIIRAALLRRAKASAADAARPDTFSSDDDADGD